MLERKEIDLAVASLAQMTYEEVLLFWDMYISFSDINFAHKAIIQVFFFNIVCST